MTNDSRSRTDLSCCSIEVVGQSQQCGDELPVALDALAVQCIPVGTSVPGGRRRTLDDESTLRAGGNDHGVLHRLRLDQAEDLGAEILSSIRPPQATTGHRTQPQVRALDAR